MSKSGTAAQTGILLFGPGGLRLSSLQSNLVSLTSEQYELVNKAKKYATEQSIKSLMTKQVAPTNQQKSLQRHQALVLMCRVYVGSISFELKEETIKAAFAAYGTIKSINMSWDPVTLKHKGFAFVEYELPEAAQLALEHMNGIQLGGRQIKVGRPSNMPQAAPVIQQIQEECKENNRIYVSNVHPDLSEHELAELFEPFGTVTSCKLAMTPNVDQPQHRGCGFIEFDTQGAAIEALTMDKLDLGGTILHVCQATTPAENVTVYGTLDSSASGGQTTATSTGSEEDIQLQLEKANKEQEKESGDSNNDRLEEGEQTNSSTNDKTQHKLATNGYSNEQRQQKSDASNVIVLRNMVTADDDLDDNLQLDVYEECSKHGQVTQVVIYVDKKVRQLKQEECEEEGTSSTNEEGKQAPVYKDEVKIFVKYQEGSSSVRALEALNGRFFAGRKVSAEHYDKESFRRHIYTQ